MLSSARSLASVLFVFTIFCVSESRAEAPHMLWEVNAQSPIVSASGSQSDLFLFEEGAFVRLDSKTRAEKWRRPVHLKKPSAFQAQAVLTSDSVIFTSATEITALDQKDGRVLWTQNLQSMLLPYPTVDQGILYIQKMSRQLFALDVHTGKVLWTFPSEPISEPRSASNGELYAAPIVYHDTVIFWGSDSLLHAAKRETGQQLWVADSLNLLSPPVIADDQVVFCSDRTATQINGNGNIYSLAAESGKLKWQLETSDCYMTPAVASKNLVFFSNRTGVQALDIVTGRPTWSYLDTREAIRARLLSFGHTLVNMTDAGVTAIDQNSGQPLWQSAFSSDYRVRKMLLRLDERSAVIGEGSKLTAVSVRDPASSSAPTIAPVLFHWSLSDTFGPAGIGNNEIILPTARGDVLCVNKSDGTIRWKAAPDEDHQASQVQTVLGDSVYLTGLDAKLYRLTLTSGEVIKSTPISGTASIFTPQTRFSDGKVYIGENRPEDPYRTPSTAAAANLVTLDSNSLEKIATVPVEGAQVGTPPVIVGTMSVFSAVLDSKPHLMAVNTATGAFVWKTPLSTPAYTTPLRANSGLVLPLPTVIWGHGVFFGDSSELILLSSDQGKILWSQKIPGRINPEIVLRNGQIIVTSSFAPDRRVANDQSKPALHVISFDEASGNKRWEKTIDLKLGPATSNPIIHKDHLYFAADGFLYSCDPDSGNENWKYSIGGEALALLADNEHVYVQFQNKFQALHIK